jgi:hypothetical protein
MNSAQHVAKHLREVFFGGNWTSVNLKDTLAFVTREQATTRVGSFNTIAALVFHIHYYVGAILKVLRGGPLDAHDQYSFDLPPIESDEAWASLLLQLWLDAEALTQLIERLPDERLWADFAEPKYGTHYRNFQGLSEHTHYHLGQIVLLKKLLSSPNPD